MLKSMTTIMSILLLGLGLGACSTYNTEAMKDVSPTAKAAEKAKSPYYTVIEFAPGSSSLNEAARGHLRDFTAKATSDGRQNAIDEIHVIAWADQEYPAEGMKATKQEVELADRRADAVQNYINDNLNSSIDVDKHNMAKRPNYLQEVAKTKDYELKKVFEGTGAAPTEGDDRMVLSGNKAAKAVILVEYE